MGGRAPGSTPAPAGAAASPERFDDPGLLELREDLADVGVADAGGVFPDGGDRELVDEQRVDECGDQCLLGAAPGERGRAALELSIGGEQDAEEVARPGL